MKKKLKQRANQRRRQQREIQMHTPVVDKQIDLIDQFILSGEFEKALKDFGVVIHESK